MRLGSGGDWLFVGMGGFAGAVLRYALSGLIHRVTAIGDFPIGTLVVNVSGCLLIGLLAGIADSRSAIGPQLRLFLLIGLLGGFTTFSSFGYETLALLRDSQSARALANISAHLVLGLGGVWVGYVAGRLL